MPEVISPDQHRAHILATVRPLPGRALPLLESLGLTCVDDVHAEVSVPRFDNSAMDGYAVRRADVDGASAASPVTLPVVGEIGAGRPGLSVLPPGSVAKIMTGAPVPAGADAVVPYEWTDRGVETVEITQVPGERQHVRSAGEDLRAGDRVVAAGTTLTARHLGLLASVGKAEVTVRPRPRVVVISTGSELRAPGDDLAPDSIYDGNSYLLAAAAMRAGAEVDRVGIVGDATGDVLDTLRSHLAGADLVVTSGGVSQGDFDVVKEALRPEGIWFGPVAMQPGKPQGFGLLAAPGGREVPVFTLPGNPVSSYVSFHVFVLPALRHLMGLQPAEPPTLRARVGASLRSPAERRQFLRGRYDAATGRVTPVGGPGSHLIGGLAQSDCLLVVPEHTTELAAGDEVEIHLLDGVQW